jgi:hypothetical protein
MTADTVGLGFATSGDRVAAKYVLLRRDRLKMLRVHAARVSAQMVQLKARGDWTAKPLVVETMSVLHTPIVAHAAIPTGRYCTLPDPAPRDPIDNIVH